MRIPDTPYRVPEHTDTDVNERIRRSTQARILWLSRHHEHIDQRLAELDKEWSTERVLETNAAALAFFGTALVAAGRRRWAILPLAVTGFLFQHGVQGWCPPLPIIRRLGVRTPQEIEAERHALQTIRGDFDHHTTDSNDIERVEHIMRATPHLTDQSRKRRTQRRAVRSSHGDYTSPSSKGDDHAEGHQPQSGSERTEWTGRTEPLHR